ncbi:hypothetical protein Q3G72_009481 [Acer saccharum]|nr:hypothetical protein Q3G72_009481 [Acer saccharum]
MQVRREKTSELVLGCNKFLSMKLATVNPELNIDIERILSKDILHSRSGGVPIILGFSPGMNSSQPYPHRLFPGTMPSIPSTIPQFPSLSQNVFDHELQSLFQMGFDSSSAVDSLGPNGNSEVIQQFNHTLKIIIFLTLAFYCFLRRAVEAGALKFGKIKGF